MGKYPDLYSSHAWRKLTAQVKARDKRTNRPCYLCGRTIRWDAPTNHTLEPTVHHLDPVNMGGAKLPPIHRLVTVCRGCNSSYGDGTQPTPLIRQRRNGGRIHRPW